MPPSIPSSLIAPSYPRAFDGHLSPFDHIADDPRWDQLIHTNLHGGASGRVQMVIK